MEFIALDVEFSHIDAFARLEVIVERHHLNWDGAARLIIDHVSPMIDV
jgi:hypothetical protein